MTCVSDQRQADRLLERIRMRVARLRRLEQAGADRSELRKLRREITGLQWQLARLVSQRPIGGDLAAANAACPRSGPVEGVWGNREVPPAGARPVSAPTFRPE
jgi:hypothetical protein